MNIVVAAGGRFHAIRLAQELYKRDVLYRLVSGSFTRADQAVLPASHVTSIASINLIDQLIWRTKLASFIKPSTLYVMKDNWFDWRLGAAIDQMDAFDIFTGWAHYFFNSIDAIKKKAKIIIVESGSCHIEEHERLVSEECAKLGLPTNHLNASNKNKIIAEYHASDYIMTPSTFARQSFLRKGFPARKVLEVPCGMDINFFRREPRMPQLATAMTFFRLLFVGQLQIGKGIHHLLEAWERLKIPRSRGELVLVGNLQRDMRLFLHKRKLPSGVTIIPGVDRHRLKELYASASAFVLPSIQDGFGMVLGEAMATGLPVIASTHTGGPDIITHGKDGLIFSAGDVQALTESIHQLYIDQELQKSLGLAGMKRIEAFNWDHYGDTTFKLYKQLMDNLSSKQETGLNHRQIQL